ncbi:hypothetical protein Lepto7376_4040 [[Leptolyngbya] sp. PCC 7376]|uniref:hypothetical protein n=1 Tax=[Leptolyngbya] sp. PCC 7376 TaxID=111781 RepID=UPI00029F2A4B|nr:hypothetical protein [[Leptolyngbya] sp. PCC 7376]AFY40175.1 hypothetical protein Lepto7376_4040 [[Leptolyngbya] sp. PCC 7376]
MTNTYFENIPSCQIELLQKIIGQRVENLIRYSWWSAEESTAQADIDEHEVFSLTAGPLLLYFDSGLVIGAASNPSLNSVTVWIEEDQNEVVQSGKPIESDAQLFPIEARDRKYSHLLWRKLIGQKVCDFTILKQKPINVLYEDLPNEVGIIITFEQGLAFVLSHGLHDDSDDFSVIQKSHISEQVLNTIIEIQSC